MDTLDYFKPESMFCLICLVNGCEKKVRYLCFFKDAKDLRNTRYCEECWEEKKSTDDSCSFDLEDPNFKEKLSVFVTMRE